MTAAVLTETSFAAERDASHMARADMSLADAHDASAIGGQDASRAAAADASARGLHDASAPVLGDTSAEVLHDASHAGPGRCVASGSGRRIHRGGTRRVVRVGERRLAPILRLVRSPDPSHGTPGFGVLLEALPPGPAPVRPDRGPGRGRRCGGAVAPGLR